MQNVVFCVVSVVIIVVDWWWEVALYSSEKCATFRRFIFGLTISGIAPRFRRLDAPVKMSPHGNCKGNGKDRDPSVRSAMTTVAKRVKVSAAGERPSVRFAQVWFAYRRR